MDESSMDFRKSKYFQLTLRDMPNIEEDMRIFNAKYRRFIEHDDGSAGVILRSHLIVEHFLDLYLVAAHPTIQDWESARLSFPKKLALADHSRTIVHQFMPGLRALNALRNHLVHRLDADTDEALMEPMREITTAWMRAAEQPEPEGLDVVREFALLASGALNTNTCTMERHVPERGLVGLFDLWDDGEGGSTEA